MNVILRKEIRFFYQYSSFFKRILSCSQRHYTTDDFYGLVAGGSGKDENDTETRSNLLKELKKIDPHEFVPDDTKPPSNTLTLPYGFIRYDKQKPDNVEKITSRTKTPETNPSEYDQHNKRRKIRHLDDGDTSSNKDISEIGESLNEQRNMSWTNDVEENSDFNFIDQQFFHYDAPKSVDCQYSLMESDSFENKETTSPKDLSFIDSQYFQNDSAVSADVPIDSQSKACTKSMPVTYREQIEGAFLKQNERDKNSDPNYGDGIGLSQMSFIDEQYFDPKLNRRNLTSQTPVKKKQTFTLNEDKTGITQSMFEEAKDFRQVKQVINRYRKEKHVSFDGKAYSVVKGLREKNQSSSIEGKRITYDSQGYRILKNQVPQFEHASSLDIIRLIRKNLLYEGNDIVAINKPYGLPSHGGPGVKHSVGQLIDAILPSCKLHLIHRLDKETTGVMLLAKTADMASQLQLMFQKQEVKKRYLAITKGYPSSPNGLIDIPITEGKVGDRYRMTLRPYRSPELSPIMPRSQGGSTAKTLYRVLDSKNMASLIECIAITGIKHQIRVHLAFGLNCPIIGDHKYAHFNEISPMQLHPETLLRLKIRQSKVRYVPMHLHARSIMIPHLLDGKHLFISAPLPYFFVENMRSLKLNLPPKC